MINIDPAWLNEVKIILKNHVPNCKILAFGSRVNGKPDKFSDLDLALNCKTPLTLEVLGSLKDSFAASNLPISVDIVDLNRVSDSFRAHIETTGVKLE